MKCPHCQGIIEFESYVEYNVECYGKSVIGRTKCCGKGLRVKRIITFVVSPLTEYENPDSDDWGQILEK
jgi:hypothetical protein